MRCSTRLAGITMLAGAFTACGPERSPKSAQAAPVAPLAETAPAPQARSDLALHAQLAQAYAAQRQSVIQAQQSNAHPQRLNPSLRARPFDRAAWQANPWETALAWAQVAEPGRARLEGEPTDPPLAVQGDLSPEITAAGSEIVVQVPPFAPVSVFSPDRLTFGPGDLPYLTTVADAQGTARIPVVVPSGTGGQAVVQVACPVAAGSVPLFFLIK